MNIIVLLFFFGFTNCQYSPNGCPSNPSVNLLLRDETDCGRYYQCNNGQPISMSCATGTFFDEVLQRCDWPDQVDCVQDSSTIGIQAPEWPFVVSSTAKVTTTTEATTLTDVITSELPQTTAEQSTTATKEITTTTEKLATTTEQSPITTEEPTTETELPATTTKQPPTTNEELTTTTPSSTITTLSTTTTPVSTTEADIETKECPSKFDINVHLPQYENCDEYLKCKNGLKLVLACRKKKFFNVHVQVKYNKLR